MKNRDNKLYQSKAWKDLRAKQLGIQPYCSVCKKTTDLQVDHIFEHNNNHTLFYSLDNLQTLCINCHGYKSTLELRISHLPIGNYVLNLINEDNSVYERYKDIFSSNRELIEYYLENELRAFKIINLKVKNIPTNALRLMLSLLFIKFNSKPCIINIDEAIVSSTHIRVDLL